MAIRYDAGRLGKIERTPQGGARIPASLTRTGILTYRNADGSTRLELRPPDEVFRKDSLDTLRSATVTEGHAAWVTSENWREHARGHVAESSVRKDGELVSAELVVQADTPLKRIDSNELSELSCGYTCDYDATPGTYQGQRYDGVQRNIRYNHVALLPAGGGRAGRDCAMRLDAADAAVCDESPAASAAPIAGASPEGNRPMKIRFDGKEYDVSKPEEALALQHAADKVRADASEATKDKDKQAARADQAESDLKKLQAESADTKRFDAAVAARVALEGAARTVLGDKFETKNKSDREIMVAVVRGDSKDFKDEGKSDDYVRSRFDAVCEKGVRADSITTVITKVHETKTREDSSELYDPERARLDMIERNQTAWQKSEKAN